MTKLQSTFIAFHTYSSIQWMSILKQNQKKTMKEWDVVVSHFYRWLILLSWHVLSNILYHILSDQIRYSLNWVKNSILKLLMIQYRILHRINTIQIHCKSCMVLITVLGLFYTAFSQIIHRGSTKYSFSDKLWKELTLRTIKLLSLMHAWRKKLKEHSE